MLVPIANSFSYNHGKLIRNIEIYANQANINEVCCAVLAVDCGGGVS